jgi:hypothetical protein
MATGAEDTLWQRWSEQMAFGYIAGLIIGQTTLTFTYFLVSRRMKEKKVSVDIWVEGIKCMLK